MDSWEGIKRDGTTVLEAAEIKGLKISLGNALHSTRNYSRRNLIQGQILSPVLNMYNNSVQHFEDSSAHLFSAFMFSHFVWYSAFAFVSDSNRVRHMLGGPEFRRIQ